MTMMLSGLTEEQKVILLIFSLIILSIFGILHLIKIGLEDKIEKCNNKLIKKIFEEL